MNATPIPNLQERLAQAIREKKMTMKPKWRLVLPHALAISGAVLIAIAVILHTSSLLYGLRLNGSLLLIQAGLGNLGYVLRAFPWLLAGLAVAVVLTLALVVSRTTRAYRLPILYSIIAIPLAVIAISLIIETLPGHEQLQKFTTTSLPVVGTFYKNVADTEPANTYIGEVRNVNAGSFTLINRKGDAIPVDITGTTKLTTPTPVKDSHVVQVIGRESHGKVDAGSIQNVPANFQKEVLDRIRSAEEEKVNEEKSQEPESEKAPENTTVNAD